MKTINLILHFMAMKHPMYLLYQRIYVFVLGDFHVHHKDWLTYFGGTDRFSEFGYNFSISNEHTQMVNFPSPILDSYSHSLAPLDFFLCSDPNICFEAVLRLLGNSDHVVASVSMPFCLTQRGLLLFIVQRLIILLLTGKVFVII